jgi:hypothetical protein
MQQPNWPVAVRVPVTSHMSSSPEGAPVTSVPALMKQALSTSCTCARPNLPMKLR